MKDEGRYGAKGFMVEVLGDVTDENVRLWTSQEDFHLYDLV